MVLTGGLNKDTPLLDQAPGKPFSDLTNPCLISILTSVMYLLRKQETASLAFWKDLWIGEQKLETLFPRLFSLEVNKDCKVVDRCNLTNGPHTRTWQWRRPGPAHNKCDTCAGTGPPTKKGHQKFENIYCLMYLCLQNNYSCSVQCINIAFCLSVDKYQCKCMKFCHYFNIVVRIGIKDGIGHKAKAQYILYIYTKVQTCPIS